MSKFKLLEGTHYEVNPDYKGEKHHHPDRMKKYERGDIIDSPRELDRIYTNKFERLIEGTHVAQAITEGRRQAVAQLVAQGLWQDADRDFLEGLTDSDFERVTRHSSLRLSSGEQSAQSILGVDVTHQFQRAYDEGYKVWKNPAGKHQITRAGSDKPLNPKPLEVDQVDKWLGSFLKEK